MSADDLHAQERELSDDDVFHDEVGRFLAPKFRDTRKRGYATLRLGATEETNG